MIARPSLYARNSRRQWLQCSLGSQIDWKDRLESGRNIMKNTAEEIQTKVKGMNKVRNVARES